MGHPTDSDTSQVSKTSEVFAESFQTFTGKTFGLVL
jgi:hypothetical protein